MRLYEALACGALPMVTGRNYWASFMPADMVEPFLEACCNFAPSTTGHVSGSTCSRAPLRQAALNAITALRADAQGLDARQQILQRLLSRRKLGTGAGCSRTLPRTLAELTSTQ